MVRHALWAQFSYGVLVSGCTDVSLFCSIERSLQSNAIHFRICWPFSADQPSNAANVSWTHGAGYELFEVRNDHGLLPIRRLGEKRPSGTVESVRDEFCAILKLAYGNDGALKRTKAQWFAEQLASSWAQDGSATLDVQRVFDVAG